MKIKKTIPIFLAAAFVMTDFVGRSARSSDTQHPQMESVSDSIAFALADSVARADSIALANALAGATTASEKYKNLKFVQFEGVTEAELYPKVLDTHKSVMRALGMIRLPEEERIRMRGMLLDLDPLLMKGAVYYSGAGNKDEMNSFAMACVDTRMRSDMVDFPFSKSAANLYPSMVYIAASTAYNSENYDKAIEYFKEYLKTGDEERHEQIAMFLGNACIISKTPEKGIEELVRASNKFPTNYNLLMITLQNCLDAGEYEAMTPLLERALLMRPDDEQLLNVRAALYENEGNYAQALEVYNSLYELHPTNLAVNAHIALCYYNVGVDYYNSSMMESDEKVSKRKMRQAKAYLSNATSKLEAIVDNEPSNTKYLKALAMAYGCLGETEKLQDVNVRLQALGIPVVTVVGMPESVTYSDNQTARSSKVTVPPFQDYARSFVEQNLAEWSKRKEFEKVEDFEKRVSQDNVYNEYKHLCKLAETAYLKKYAGRIRLSDLRLQPYDIENESYLINSDMGSMVVKVPMKNREAEAFKSGWPAMQFRNPKYFIKDNHVAVASVDFVTPAGKTYTYNAESAANYDFTEVQVDVSSFLAQGSQTNPGSKIQEGKKTNAERVIRAKSDVDSNIPLTSRKADNKLALIWANENYKNVSPVSSALNDGEAFYEYCSKTLGIPEGNIFINKDATYAEMLGSINRLKQLAGSMGSGTEVIFYYAGHGVPDESTKDAYLLPVDGDGLTTVTAYPIKKLYDDLSSMRADNVLVFMDACFSGATRDGEMIAQARGVALKPKQADPEGNMFVLTAASDKETAMPYREKNHGLFTYFLLKKIQESKGNVTLKDLGDYVVENVRSNSVKVNRKLQTPSVRVSGRLATEYDQKKLRE